jgi:multiple sugar transport system permease protein
VPGNEELLRDRLLRDPRKGDRNAMTASEKIDLVRSSQSSRYQPSPRRLAGQVILHLILLVMSFVSITPFVWMIFASFKHFQELVRSTALLPQVWTLENYIEIIARVNFPAAFRNSALQATTVTLCGGLTSAALGFIFAKYRFWGKEKLFTLLLSTMMIPFAVVLVPLYITIADLKMSNQLSGIIVTGLWSTFGLFLMRQFMESIPSELLDAARIDGASEWRIFFTLVLPMSTSALSALTVFIFLFNWDNFLWPLVVLNSPGKQTLPLVLAGLRSLYWTRYEMWAAGSMLTVVPVMLIYIFASKYFIRGLAMTGLKA